MVLLQKLNYSTSEVAVRKAREVQARTGFEPWPLWRRCSTQLVELYQANREQVVIWVQLIAHWLWMYIYAWISCINSYNIWYFSLFLFVFLCYSFNNVRTTKVTLWIKGVSCILINSFAKINSRILFLSQQSAIYHNRVQTQCKHKIFWQQ